MRTKAEHLAEARDAAAALRKRFEMAGTNGQIGQPTADATTQSAPEAAKAAEMPAPFRAKHARPLGDDAIRAEQSRLADQIKAQGEKIDGLTEKIATLTAVPPAATLPIPPSRARPPEEIAADVSAKQEYGKLKVRLEKNGDAVFSLPLDVVRDPLKISGDSREAFRETGKSYAQQIQVTGTGDRQIRAAMQYAAIRWGGDPITIRVGDKHADKIVKHAVAANVNIDTSRDPRLAELVAAERQRQAVQIGKKRTSPCLSACKSRAKTKKRRRNRWGCAFRWRRQRRIRICGCVCLARCF